MATNANPLVTGTAQGPGFQYAGRPMDIGRVNSWSDVTNRFEPWFIIPWSLNVVYVVHSCNFRRGLRLGTCTC